MGEVGLLWGEGEVEEVKADTVGAGMGLVGLGWVGASRVGAGCKREAQMHSLRSEKGNG